uniref:Glycosyltransferase n=1 Tax=Caenorhabditis tropicalis TaxID=1561998 RepID=A0A1I7U2N1_9PELO
MYPINLMRNVARKGAKSDFHLIVDADMVMSEGFAEKVKMIVNQMIDGKNKNALVVRRFETDDQTIPKNLNQLKEAFDAKKQLEKIRQENRLGLSIDVE